MKAAAALLGLFILAAVACGAREEEPIEALIRDAAANRQHVPALMKQLVAQLVYVIARMDGPGTPGMHIQDFMRDDRSFIPVFSDQAHFRAETRGSGFEAQLIAIDGNLFASILRGDELLVLNPGSPTPVDLDARDLKAFIDAERLPKGGI